IALSMGVRVVIGVISLLAVGLLVSDVAPYLTLQSSLVSRIDDQLKSLSTVETARTALANYPSCHGRGPATGTTFDPGTITELIDTDGKIVAACGVQAFGATASNAAPVLPKTLPNAGTDIPAAPFTVEGTGGVSKYRVTDWPENFFATPAAPGGRFVVFAIPLTPVLATLRQLLLLESLIGVSVLAATALLALIIIRVSLQPLQKMGGGAADIAAGDLTRRVQPATPQTQIGPARLALNRVFNHIQAAFAERTQ